ncbi:MAG: RnfABCDGE type electron transport complex subunit G [Deltaproteobacteria bacterium]|nr:RnfABCDGE type electron transport complex subunit G [Deltaproteobacteria bacterium]
MRDIIRMIVVLTVICGVSGFTLAFVKQVTEEPREYAYLKFVKEPSIKAVLSGYDNDPIKDRITLTLGKDETGKPVEKQFFPAKQGGKVIGVAFDSSAPGYGGPIDVMIGVNEQGVVDGISIMKHSETPGLGARTTEPSFTGQFKGLNLDGALNLTGNGGKVQAVSGTSVSSGAVVRAVRQALELLPKIKQEVFSS